MNFPSFIARRVANHRVEDGKGSFSSLIIRIAVVAVALSVAVMIITTALIRGFKHEISSKIFGFMGHIHITDTNATGGLTDGYPIYKTQNFYPYLDTVRTVRYLNQRYVGGAAVGEPTPAYTNAGIRHIQAFAIKPGIMETKKEIEGIILKGVDSDFDWDFMRQYIVRGDTITRPDSAMSREILISQRTADRLQLDTGQVFRVNFVEQGEQIRRNFKIAGIYNTALEEYDKRFALIDIRQIQRILGWNENQVGGFEVFVEDIEDLKPIADYIYLEQLPNSMYAETIREKFPETFSWLEMQNVNERVIILLLLIVSIINMITALLILILERTNMIGILKALGSSNWEIRKIFLYYAANIILWGLFLGNLFGIGLCLLQKYFRIITLSEEDYYLSYAPIKFDFWTILLLNVGTLGIILLFLIIPSYLVTRIKPVQAIRFK